MFRHITLLLHSPTSIYIQGRNLKRGNTLKYYDRKFDRIAGILEEKNIIENCLDVSEQCIENDTEAKVEFSIWKLK